MSQWHASRHRPVLEAAVEWRSKHSLLAYASVSHVQHSLPSHSQNHVFVDKYETHVRLALLVCVKEDSSKNGHEEVCSCSRQCICHSLTRPCEDVAAKHPLWLQMSKLFHSYWFPCFALSLPSAAATLWARKIELGAWQEFVQIVRVVFHTLK